MFCYILVNLGNKALSKLGQGLKHALQNYHLIRCFVIQLSPKKYITRPVKAIVVNDNAELVTAH